MAADHRRARDRRPVPSPLHGAELGGPGARRSPTTTSAAPGRTTPSTTAAGRPSRCPATGARPRPSPTPTARCSTGARSTPWARPRAAAAWLTFDGLFYQGDVWLDGAYLGDTEGYFAPHTFEVTDALARPRRAPPGRRGHLRAPDRPHRQAQHHRRLPALGLPRPRLEPGRHLAAGAGDRDGAGAHRPAAGAVPGGDARAGGARAARHARQRRRPHGVRAHARSAGSTTSPTSRSPPAPTTSSGR